MSTIAPTVTQSSKPPILPLDFNANQPKTIRLYPLTNYTFGVKETQPEEDQSVIARLQRLQEHYSEHGMRRTCEGILVCHEHNHPHILMLQIANAFFKLPGDYLRPEDEEIEGFKARLDERLAPVGRLGEGEEAGDWQIGDCLAQWWRPNFETFMYPFVPAHVTRPKECKKLYFIQLPKSKILSVPKNMKLLAVPLFELYDNTARYGPQLSAIPHLLSRYNFEFVDEDGHVVALTPGTGPDGSNLKTKVLAGGDDVDMNHGNENETDDQYTSWIDRYLLGMNTPDPEDARLDRDLLGTDMPELSSMLGMQRMRAWLRSEAAAEAGRNRRRGGSSGSASNFMHQSGTVVGTARGMVPATQQPGTHGDT